MEWFIGLCIYVIFLLIYMIFYEDKAITNHSSSDTSNSSHTKFNVTSGTSNDNHNKSNVTSDYSSSSSYNIDYLEVHTSKIGLAKKLLRDTGSKRMTKDILVERYGYSQSEAKSLAGYKGY